MKHRISKRIIAIILTVAVLIPGSMIIANATCDHDYSVKRTIVQPGCTTQGIVHYYCSLCDEDEGIDYYTNTIHENIENGTDTADSYVVVIKEATCTTDGKIELYCNICDDYIKTQIVEAKGHSNGYWTLDFEATADHDGQMSFYCVDCGQIIESKSFSLHEHEYGYERTLTPATCTADGETGTFCAICGLVYDVETIPATGHYNDSLEWYLTDADATLEDCFGCRNVDTVLPTCTSKGRITFNCDYCGEAVRSYDLDPADHDEGVWRIDFEPTADHDGQMTRYCSVCGAALESKTFSLHTHTYGYEAVCVAPTCTEDGEMGTFCAACGNVYDTEVIPALGHDFGTWCKNHDGTHTRGCSRCQYYETANCEYETVVTEPTCTQIGYTTYTCRLCDFTFKFDFTEPLGHDWGEWKDDANGSTHTRTCARCGEKETADHEFTEWTFNNDAKFFKNGTKSRVCPICGCKETEEAHHTSYICRVVYPPFLWVVSILRKVLFVGSLNWLLPWLNLYPKM
ncbi:MAG: hypothetical protein IJU39_07295 [Clostridia bacterium]|nr:hypothetical protein [Clostridia bacterium]